QNPLHEVLLLVGILGFHFLVGFFVTVVELDFLTAGDVVDELVHRSGIALVLGGNIAQRRAILLLVDGMALIAATVLYERLGRVHVERPGGSRAQAGGCREEQQHTTAAAAPLIANIRHVDSPVIQTDAQAIWNSVAWLWGPLPKWPPVLVQRGAGKT